ncbi:MAG: Aspartyl protease [Massilia sp.]|nr:Aspartyl protease [Massilia sp.]
MSIRALEIKDVDLRLMELPHQGEMLILGADFLHRHRVYIAMSRMQIHFSPIDAPKAVKRGSPTVIAPPVH